MTLQPCGTSAAQKRHRRAREACEACGYRYTGKIGAAVTRPCGTESAYRRHRRRGEPTCGPCRSAHAGYTREQRAAA